MEEAITVEPVATTEVVEQVDIMAVQGATTVAQGVTTGVIALPLLVDTGQVPAQVTVALESEAMEAVQAVMVAARADIVVLAAMVVLVVAPLATRNLRPESTPVVVPVGTPEYLLSAAEALEVVSVVLS